jgi:PAS domain S-box-containing protein/putative nucleotidyltransferase with HDIG domain
MNIATQLSSTALGQVAIEQLASIVIGSDDAIISKNLDGVITTWNRGAEKIFGYTAEEAIGKNVEILIPPERYKDEALIFKQILLGQRVSHFEAIRLCKDGKKITVSITVSPIFDGNGNVVGASKIARDITAQKIAAAALLVASQELLLQGNEKAKRAAELVLANEELAFQNSEKDKRASELVLANEEKANRAAELVIANAELAFQNQEKDKRVLELVIANEEKANRASELLVANAELAFQNGEKDKRANELVLANEEKANRAAELVIANTELAFQNSEKDKRVSELVIANEEKASRAAELLVANVELAFQSGEKDKRAGELVFANEEKANRASELVIANAELAFQNSEKDKRVAELVIANEEKANRAAELLVANVELAFQNSEKDKRSAELVIANEEKVRLKSKNNEKLEVSLMETIAIARQLVELRDPYTAGHEKHVGDLAKSIAFEMGFDEKRQEGLMIAGYLHDIGKIIVPVEILCKPGKITPEEYNLIKNHVQAGYDLLKDVSFPWDIAQAVLEHHERLDGSGYPNALKGSQISMDGRILGVVDVVEAMSSYRPYRPALGMAAALAEIERGRGLIYDAEVVDVCLRLFREKAYVINSSLTASH